MRAALRFAEGLGETDSRDRTARVTVDLYGSLALTGKGHGTDRAVLLGLMGEAPAKLDPASVEGKLARVTESGRLPLNGRAEIGFNPAEDLRFHKQQMYPEPGIATHPNGMRFCAFDASGQKLADEVFYSVGGGFIVSAAEFASGSGAAAERVIPYPFRSAEELLRIAHERGLTIPELVLANECALMDDPRVQILRPEAQGVSTRERVEAAVLQLWHAMESCTQRGMEIEGVLPGGLNVRRRAPRLARRLRGEEPNPKKDPLNAIDWVTMWAMAVNEENAAGGRVVTAPTNGAAGVVPAIAHYYVKFVAEGLSEDEKREGLLRFFLSAAAIGILYKENASISGAEVGCQGEVGVACSMAAGGLVAAQSGTNEQVEHAAEIAMEHNLGMTCDPIGGLVQIPCIERNGMGAVKAINASRLAMHETEGHKLSLDQIIKTMYQTGMDMQSRYKETSLAGLALNVIEC
jgi:L-serine dehydratase